ncbi:hypothetical protein D1AOALGA4SA_5923 [Olavius algarvensis Delta 1 endosymbiont]|nr:hypothetical protein D1AOALGA4SA_5923 [Olavius algarvensis Delta 1 endosymbiont]
MQCDNPLSTQARQCAVLCAALCFEPAMNLAVRRGYVLILET